MKVNMRHDFKKNELDYEKNHKTLLNLVLNFLKFILRKEII